MRANPSHFLSFKLGLLLLALLLISGVTQAVGVSEPQSSKIDPALWQLLQSRSETDFIIIVDSQADLSGAAALATKEEKGRFVFEALRAHAERTQSGLRRQLDSQGVAYQPFYISNKIYVEGGGQELVTSLAARADVARLVPNRRYQLVEPLRGEERDQSRGIESNLTFIRADQVWELGITGEGVVLAGNDTGMQWDHPALKPHYRGWDGTTANHNYSWWDATGTYTTGPGDGNGHGTHTTGTMVGDDGSGNQIGVAPGARAIHCKNLDDGGFGTDADIIECFQWDLAPWDLTGANPRPEMAPDAINNSWGGGGGRPVFMAEIDALQAAGILVEFSAGNSGPSCSTLGSPGDFPQVLTTGSVNHASGVLPGEITWFSSRGPSLFTEEFLPDIMAPGENVRSSLPGGSYGSFSGTSMSGPHVTALIALMWDANPGLRGLIEETTQLIMQTAIPLSGQIGSNCGGDYDEGPNNDWGHGTIDALAAVDLAMQFGSPGLLTGKVTDADSGAPLAGVQVRARLSPNLVWRRQTDAAGIYNMTLFSGTYTVTTALYGYLPQTVTNVQIVADETTTIDFALDPAPLYTVSGRVFDAATGWPLHARITFENFPGDPVWSDPLSGEYSIELAGGTDFFIHVTPWAEGYVQYDRPLSMLDADQTIDFGMTADSLTCLAPGYQAEVLFTEDFESDDAGFTVEGFLPTWQHGRPSSGPNSALSGENVWATNLSGNYNDNENSRLMSPVYDLSANEGAQIIVSWWQWLQTEPCCDYVMMEVSNDGGTSWSGVYFDTSDQPSGWTKRVISLDSSYATAEFRVRFSIVTDSSVTFPGYYIDDFAVGVAHVPPPIYSENFEAGDGGYDAAGSNSSWQHGVPTRGPGAAHSGDNAWATRLGGNYNDDESSTLTSPVIDISAGAGQMIQVTWWQWLQTELNADTLQIEYSSDGGASWNPAYFFSGVVDMDWTRYFLFLDQEAITDQFQLRFTLTTDDGVTYPGFYVDDIRVEQYFDQPPGLPCFAAEGGLIVGTVRDANNGQPLNGATVSTVADSVRSSPGEDDGFYTVFAPSGSQPVSATRRGYGADQAMVAVSLNEAVGHDFALTAGLLSTEPSALEATLPLGAQREVDLRIRNNGGATTLLQLRERDGGFTPARTIGHGEWLWQSESGQLLRYNGGGEQLAMPSAYHWKPLTAAAGMSVLVYNDDFVHQAPDTYTDQALQALGVEYTAYYDGAFDQFLAALNSQAWDVVIFANDYWFPPDFMFSSLNTYVASGGRLIYHSWTTGFNPSTPLFSTLGISWQGDDYDPPDPVYWWESDHPVFNRPQEVPPLLTPSGGMYGIYGQQVEPLEGALALAGYTTLQTPNQAALVLANEGRTVYKGFLDGQHSGDSDNDGVPDLVDLWINLLDGIQTDFSYDIPWLSLSISEGQIDSGGAIDLTATFDASVAEIDQPGSYQGSIRMANDTPYGALNVPVTMNVLPPANWGKLTGTVNGLTRCDQPGSPLRNAKISIDGQPEITTRGDGDYTRWMTAGRYSVTVTREGYVDQRFSVQIDSGATSVRVLNLRPTVPCSALGRDASSVSVEQGQRIRFPIALHNRGAGAWRYRALETEFDLLQPPALRSPASVRATATVDGPASVRNSGATGIALDAQARSGWFGGAENPGGAVRYGAAQCMEEPDAFYVISGVDRFSGLTRAVWRYDAETNDWIALQPIPTAQESPTATCYQNRLYVMGGGGSTQFFVYDLSENEWLAAADLPRAVEGAAAAAWNGKIYLVGGDNDFYPGSGVSNEVNIYDIASDSWIGRGADMLFGASHTGFIQTGPYLYTVGGWGELTPDSNVKATQRYDIEADTWQLGPEFSSGRADFALAATEQALYAIGGDEDGRFYFDASAKIDRLALADWPNGEWQAFVEPLPVPLVANSAGFCTRAVFNPDRSEIWSVGGFDGGAIGTRSIFYEIAAEDCYSIFGGVQWLTLDSSAGVIAADAAGALWFTIDATNLAPGRYTATVVTAGNDRQIWHPIELTVTEGAPVYRQWLPLLFSQP